MFGIFKRKTKEEKPFVSAVIAAGGIGQRMGENKLMLELDEMPFLAHSLIAIERSPLVDEIVIVVYRDFIVEYRQLSV